MKIHSICRKASVFTLFILNYCSSTLNTIKNNVRPIIQYGQQKKKKKIQKQKQKYLLKDTIFLKQLEKKSFQLIKNAKWIPSILVVMRTLFFCANIYFHLFFFCTNNLYSKLKEKLSQLNLIKKVSVSSSSRQKR